MSTPHETISDAFAQLAQFQPESASEMERFWAAHQEMLHEASMAYSTLADRMQSEMPFGSSTADATRDLGAAFGSLADVAAEVHTTFRAEHEAELSRIENPRAGEQLWDIDKQ